MRRLINAWLLVMIISSLFGAIVITQEWVSVRNFFFPMAIADTLLIWYINKDPIPEITDLFSIVLTLAMVNHTFGAINWLGYNQMDAYLSGLAFILILEVLVIAGGVVYRHINGRYGTHNLARMPGIINVVENKTCH